MRSSHFVFVGCAVAIAIAVACGGSSSSDSAGATPVENPPGTPPGTPGGPTPPPAMAVGDPCRGAPVPADQAHVADGMCARLVANGLGNVRQMTFASDGTMFAGSNNGQIYRLHDDDGDGFFAASEIKLYASFSGGNGNNVSLDESNGFLYAGYAKGVKRWAWSPTSTSGGTAQDVITDAPSGGNHPLHTVRVWDGYLYVHSGSSNNASLDSATAAPGDYDDNRALIRRFPLASYTPGTPLAWLSGEIVTQGLRNSVGLNRNAKGRMFAVVNGLDDVVHAGVNVHNDNPGEQVLEIAMGKKYGYPFCFTAQRVVENGAVITAGTQLWNQNFGQHDDAWCATNAAPPATFIQAHSAPLDIFFFDVQPMGALPEKYRGGAFIALHGSWDRQPATGYKVIWMPFDASGNATMPTSTADATTFPYETVFGGGTAAAAQDGPWAWQSDSYSDSPRFSGVAISPIDGALYAASDSGGTIYRLGLPKSP
ncbi:MAG TPA: hypothetical protein VIF62_21920 [Labilithrix sp.]